MTAASDKKIAEGLEHLRLGEKCVKTGIFKWKPDYDGAASEYSKAAVAFKNAKAYEQATHSYIKCSEVQSQMGSKFHAAKSLESAALIYKDMKEFDKAGDMVEQASTLYLEHGVPDTAAICLEKAGKMLEASTPDRAIVMYLKAYDVSEAEDKPRHCAEMVGKAGRVLIRLKRFDEAAERLSEEIRLFSTIDHNGLLYKLVMGLVLVHLHRSDSVAADKAFQQCLRYEGFAESEEAPPIQSLLIAYTEGDQERAEQIVKSPLFRYMENDFTKLARDLRVPGSGRKHDATDGAEPGLNEPEEDEDEDEDDEGIL